MFICSNAKLKWFGVDVIKKVKNIRMLVCIDSQQVCEFKYLNERLVKAMKISTMNLSKLKI